MLFFVLVFAFNMQSYGIRLFTRLVQMRRLWWQWLTSRLTGRCTRSWTMSPRRSATCLMGSVSSPGSFKWEDCDGKYRINRMTFNRVILSLVQNMYIIWHKRRNQGCLGHSSCQESLLRGPISHQLGVNLYWKEVLDFCFTFVHNRLLLAKLTRT